MYGTAKHGWIDIERCIITPVAGIVLHTKRLAKYEDSIILFENRCVGHVDQEVGLGARQCFDVDRVWLWPTPTFEVDGYRLTRYRRVRITVRRIVVRVSAGLQRLLMSDVQVGVKDAHAIARNAS